ncbi:hypothetical protein AB1399_00780 [Hydrogenibacillus schlegelii]|uniref:Uncharacterized protein n=1 Tax=Hydrogenibacillus schlegelii TaxID=1484 RepID=A0A132ND46_HYDSH|nr:hypothetical protein [Hydrogenibacillus schlegelii]KWX08089.1 hypothetical protein TR75_01370 [Hydrogenibacillus schlegelii]OAR03801.1 hypothetical protein SA87_02035 [Hydrogenibacillus schlegelii]
MARNQSVQQQNNEREVQTVKVEFVVSTDKKEVDPKLEELRKRRDTYKGNLAYAIAQQDKYSKDYTEALNRGADQLTLDRLELKLREADLRITFYKERLAKVEEEIIRYKLERKKEAVA